MGDAVWSALPIAANSGALCEFVVIESDQLCLRPTKLSHDGAATLPYACLKVWNALVYQGNNGFSTSIILKVDCKLQKSVFGRKRGFFFVPFHLQNDEMWVQFTCFFKKENKLDYKSKTHILDTSGSS